MSLSLCANLTICHRCDFIVWPPGAGRADCVQKKAKPVPIQIRAKLGCPINLHDGTHEPCPRCGKFGHVEEQCPSLKPKPDPFAPGNLVEGVLAAMGYQKHGGCGCEAFKKQMNEWGWVACLRKEPAGHRQEIVDWFCVKAKEQGLAIDGTGIWKLRRARKT